ncbi:MAG: hypothetical protein SGPRY_012417, partial [Prymnesium sp.]
MLEQLAVVVERRQESSIASLPPLHTMRGRLWVLLGLLRWRLLLPEHPVDPSCKHAVKAHVLRAREEEGRAQLRCHELSLHAWNGGLRSPSLSLRRATLLSLGEERRLAESKVCARPAEATFGELHAELWKWENSMGGRDSVMALSEELGQGGAKGEAREAAWQQSSSRWLERFEARFSAWPDVCAPVELSLYMIKQGLALQVASTRGTALAAEEGVMGEVGGAGWTEARGAHSLARSLLCFPQRTAEDLSRSLAVLLKPLPQAARPPRGRTGGGVDSTAEEHWRISQQVGLAMLAMRRLYLRARLGGGALRRHGEAMRRIMGKFAQMQVEVEAAERERAEAAASLFKHRPSEHGSEPKGEAEEAAAATRLLFPDFAEEFADLIRPAADEMDPDDVGETDGDEQRTDGDESRSSAVAAGGGGAVGLRVAPELVLQMLTYHELTFSRGGGGGGEEGEAEPATASRGKAAKRPSSRCAETVVEGGWWGVGVAEEARGEVIGSLQLAYRTAAQLLPSLGALLPSSLDREATAAH